MPSLPSTVKPTGNGVDQLALAAAGAWWRGMVEHAADVAVADLVAVDGDLDGDVGRGRLAAGDIDHHLADAFVGHLLGGIDGGADRGLGLLHVDHGAVACMPRDT